MFWPRSMTWRPGSSRVTDTGRSSCTRRTGGAGELVSCETPWSATRTGRHGPALDPVVLDLTGHQVRREDRPGRRRPSRVRWTIVAEPDLELAEERDGVAEAVGELRGAVATSVPAVAQRSPPTRSARDDEVGHVVGLDVQVRR